MNLRSAKIRPEMTYKVMDIFKLTFEKDSFGTVFDKGALDAVYPEDTPENKIKIENMFQSILDILNKNGEYICVSLL